MVKPLELYPSKCTLGLGEKKVRYLIQLIVYQHVPKFTLVTLRLLNMSGGAEDPAYSGFLEFMFFKTFNNLGNILLLCQSNIFCDPQIKGFLSLQVECCCWYLWWRLEGRGEKGNELPLLSFHLIVQWLKSLQSIQQNLVKALNS